MISGLDWDRFIDCWRFRLREWKGASRLAGPAWVVRECSEGSARVLRKNFVRPARTLSAFSAELFSRGVFFLAVPYSEDGLSELLGVFAFREREPLSLVAGMYKIKRLPSNSEMARSSLKRKNGLDRDSKKTSERSLSWSRLRSRRVSRGSRRRRAVVPETTCPRVLTRRSNPYQHT